MIANSVQSSNAGKFLIHGLELPANALDMRINGAVSHINRLSIGFIHQLISILNVAETIYQGAQQIELGHRQCYQVLLPAAFMTAHIKAQISPDQYLTVVIINGASGLVGPAQDGADPFNQHALEKRLPDVIVCSHFQAKQSAQGEFQAKPDEGVIDFGRVIRKMKQDNFDGIIAVEFVSAPDVLEAGWDLREESARLKEILEEALASD